MNSVVFLLLFNNGTRSYDSPIRQPPIFCEFGGIPGMAGEFGGAAFKPVALCEKADPSIRQAPQVNLTSWVWFDEGEIAVSGYVCGSEPAILRG